MPKPDDTMLSYLACWLLYSVFAHSLAVLLQWSRARDIKSVLLCGAMFGWMIEGAAVLTLYGVEGIPFPFTILWTGVAWHGLISVVFGYHLLGQALREGRSKKVAAYALGCGLLWGIWAVGWSQETPPLVAETSPYMIHAFASTLLFIAAHGVMQYKPIPEHTPGRWRLVGAAFFPLALFLMHAVPAIPWSIIAWPVLMGFTLLALRCCRGGEMGVAPAISLRRPTSPIAWGLLLLVPLASVGVYELFKMQGWMFSTRIPLFLISNVLGAALLAVAYFRAFQAYWKKPPSPV